MGDVHSCGATPPTLDGWDAITTHLAERWGLRRTRRTWIRCREDADPIPVTRIAGQVVAFREDLDAWIERRRLRTSDDPVLSTGAP